MIRIASLGKHSLWAQNISESGNQKALLGGAIKSRFTANYSQNDVFSTSEIEFEILDSKSKNKYS